MNLEKIKSIFIVIILTCLIWITAEQAVTKSEQIRIRLQFPQSTGDTIIEFLDDNLTTLPDNKLDVKLTVEGTTNRISQATKLNSNVFDVTTTIIDSLPEPGNNEIISVKVKDLLGGRFKIDNKNHFLLISEALPQTVNVRVTRLVKKTIPVTVSYRNQKLSPELVNPKEVEAYVLNTENTEAVIELTDRQWQEATEKPISVKAAVFTPFRDSVEFDVSVKISPVVSIIPEREINSPRFGVLWPIALEGLYKIIIDETSPQFDEYQQPIQCRGDKQMLDSFYDSPVHLIIAITVEDLANINAPIERIPIYNLPRGDAKIEIINQKKSPIRFNIIKLEN